MEWTGEAGYRNPPPQVNAGNGPQLRGREGRRRRGGRPEGDKGRAGAPGPALEATPPAIGQESFRFSEAGGAKVEASSAANVGILPGWGDALTGPRVKSP